MSRFGIRKRLKQMLDGGPAEIVHFPVNYELPDGSVQVVQAEEGYNLLMASQDLPSPISTGRRAGGPCPDGGCGLCRVEVVDGTGLSTQTERERETIAAHVRGDPHEGRAREPGSRTTSHAWPATAGFKAPGVGCVFWSCSTISRSPAIRTAANGRNRFTVSLVRPPHSPGCLRRSPHHVVHRTRAGVQAPGEGLLGVQGDDHRRPQQVSGLDDYLRILHEWTERIQSSPAAVERSVYEIIGKEYRSSRVRQIELRFNPMKRNQKGRRDLDHIIHAALRGMDKACLEYGVKAGLILCLAREFDAEANEKIVRKAIQYRGRGVVGIDLAGTETNTIELSAAVGKYAEMFAMARGEGLGTTIHTGETKATSGEGVIAVLKHLKPNRIGHGVRAAYNAEAVELLAESQTTLEDLSDIELTHARCRGDGGVPLHPQHLRRRGRADHDQHRRDVSVRYALESGV